LITDICCLSVLVSVVYDTRILFNESNYIRVAWSLIPPPFALVQLGSGQNAPTFADTDCQI